MEKDFRSLLLQRRLDGQWLNVKSSALSSDVGLLSKSAPPALPGVIDMVSTKENHPIAETNTRDGWFYHLPSLRQGFIPRANRPLNGKHFPTVELTEKVPLTTQAIVPKQFLVFDQTGDKTTLMYRIGTGNPLYANPRDPYLEPLGKHSNAHEEKFGIWNETRDISGPSNCSEAEEESEMREDTEEIDALLYSDDESTQDGEDDDEASTGHSPSIMTAYQNLEVEDGEEVSSSGNGANKRQKISDDGHKVFSFIDTASFADAESKCGNDNKETDSVKRSRKERIREAVEMLQSIIPGGQGKANDPVVVLDESIRYLKSLKHRAMCFGLPAL